MKGTDTVILREIGERLTRARVRARLTQAELAKEAGIGKRTLERLENGDTVQLTSFLRVLRALDLLDRFGAALPDLEPSPMQLLRYQTEEPRRVYKRRKPEPKKPWTWADD